MFCLLIIIKIIYYKSTFFNILRICVLKLYALFVAVYIINSSPPPFFNYYIKVFFWNSIIYWKKEKLPIINNIAIVTFPQAKILLNVK